MHSWLLIFVLSAPLVCGVLDAALKRRWFGIAGSGLSLLALLGLWLQPDGASLHIPVLLPGMGINYSVGTIGLLLSTVTVFVWLAASVFSLSYMQHEHDVSRFYLLFGLSIGGTVACFLASDFLAFLLGFELMSLASYGLVAHARDERAQAAGRLYLYLGVSGGVLLSVALALLWQHAGTLRYADLHGIPLSITALFSLGLAIKAGAFPLHFWLPEAHPVAPSPGSAVLSGILIKTGAFGLLQMATLTANGHLFGTVLIIVALATMSLGVVLAILQRDAKRMLAYSSVSQMGYILLGVGLWALDRNALGLAGAVFHMVNHAVFKSALFLISGSALLSAGTVDLYRLGAMRKAFGWATPLVLVPMLSVIGVPGFSGFASKTLLHDALLHVEAPGILLTLAERAFMIVAFGTVCYFIKFTWYMFFADRQAANQPQRAALSERLGVGLLSLATIVIGVMPQPVVNALANVAHELHAHWPEHLDLFGQQALLSAAIVLFGGALLFFVSLRIGLLRWELPARYSVISLGAGIGRLALGVFGTVSSKIGRVATAFARWESRETQLVKRSLQALDYRPSPSPSLRSLSVTNLNFDVYVVMVVLSMLIVIYPLVI